MSFNNVVFMTDFGQAKSKKKKKILYISNRGESLPLLQSFHTISVEGVFSMETLNIQLYSWKRWDLVLIESDLDWASPIETVQAIHEQMQIPVTLINKEANDEDSPFKLKDYYDVGLFDCLNSPLCPRELSEVFRALIN